LILKSNPLDIEAYFRRGLASFQLGQFRPALHDFNAALAFDHDHVQAYHHRGHVHDQLGELRKAVADFSTALGLEPQRGHFHAARGQSYQHLGEYDKAVADLQQALTMSLDKDDQVTVRTTLAWIYVVGPAKLRDARKALPLAERAAELARNDYACLNVLGIVYYRLGRWDQAVKTLQAAAADRKEGPTASNLFFLAMSYQQLGKRDKARKCYDRAVRWQPPWKLHPNQIEELKAIRAEAEAALAKRPEK
jgi:tetratricopeptide (TPR) repeat protein